MGQQYQDNQADDPLWLRENEYYSDEDNYNSDQNDEYIFIDRAEQGDQYDIFIRQPSRECDTIIEEDEDNLSEWYSTKTSHGAKPNEPRRQNSLGRSDSPLKIVEFHPKDPNQIAETDSAGDSSLRYPHYKMIKKQKMLLPFEMSSDLSEEARLCDEIRNVGLKDEGRFTYAQMLMAFRR